MKTFLFGVGLGIGAVLAPTIGLGLLYASLKEEKRKELSNTANEVASLVREAFQEKKQRIVSAVGAISSAAANGFGGVGD